MKLTMATFSCRMLVLLAIASPSVFTSGRAGAATLQPETTSLNKLQPSSSDANFAATPAEKVQALLSEKQLLAKKTVIVIKEKKKDKIIIKTNFTQDSLPVRDFTPPGGDVFQSSSSDANFAANPAEKVQALLSEKQLLAKSIPRIPRIPRPRVPGPRDPESPKF